MQRATRETRTAGGAATGACGGHGRVTESIGAGAPQPRSTGLDSCAKLAAACRQLERQLQDARESQLPRSCNCVSTGACAYCRSTCRSTANPDAVMRCTARCGSRSQPRFANERFARQAAETVRLHMHAAATRVFVCHAQPLARDSPPYQRRSSFASCNCSSCTVCVHLAAGGCLPASRRPASPSCSLHLRLRRRQPFQSDCGGTASTLASLTTSAVFPRSASDVGRRNWPRLAATARDRLLHRCHKVHITWVLRSVRI